MSLTNVGTAVNSNGIYAGGPREIGEAAGDATAILPGMVVMPSATANQITPATASATVNTVLGVALDQYRAGKAFRDTWAAGDFVHFNMAKGGRFMGILLGGSANLVAGDLLKVSSTAGKLSRWVPGTDGAGIAVARYIGLTAVTTPGGDSYILCSFGGL